MFSPSDYDFMTNNMSIKVYSIEEKLNESFLENYRELAIKTISDYINKIRECEASEGKQNKEEVEEYIESYFLKITEDWPENEVRSVFETLMHVFRAFAVGGLIDLYQYQANEGWYPIIEITKVLKPNKIASLGPPDKRLTLYRGCDMKEHLNKEYRQAWTLNLDVAQRFAFEWYEDQPWFNKKTRVILKASYFVGDVFFYQDVSDKKVGEQEVVVDTHKLRNVEIESSVDSSEI